MIYDLSKEIDVQRAQRRFDTLLEEKTVMEIIKKVVHTRKQRSYMHLIRGWFALETGYTLSETRQIYRRVNRQTYEYEKNGIPFERETSDLNIEKMSLCIDRWRNYSAEKAGVYLPEANEEKFLTEIEIELSKNRHV